MKILKRVLGGVFLCAAGFAFWWCGMNYNGYCHKEGRYLSDEEIVRSAVKWTLAGYPPSLSKNIEKTVDGETKHYIHFYQPDNPIKYQDVDEFMALNPDCCWFSMRTGEGGRPLLADRIFGYFRTYVLLEYKVRYLENNIEKSGEGGLAVAVTNCGRSWSKF